MDSFDLARAAYAKEPAKKSKEPRTREAIIADMIIAAREKQQVPDVPKAAAKSNRTTLEEASLGYSLAARDQEIQKGPAKPPLLNVLSLISQKALPESLRPLAENPPTREEARYLARELQTLADELAMLDKTIGAIPNVEGQVKTLRSQKDSWMREAIESGVTEKSRNVNGLDYPHGLETAEKMAFKFASERDSIIRGASTFASNNAETVKEATNRLGVLRMEFQEPMPYAEAKAGIPGHKKSVRAWLDDVSNKPAFEDRLLAEKVLAGGGINARAILTEVQRDGMRPFDKAVTEAVERNASPGPTSAVEGSQASGAKD
jgi:hypothetical protein